MVTRVLEGDSGSYDHRYSAISDGEGSLTGKEKRRRVNEDEDSVFAGLEQHEDGFRALVTPEESRHRSSSTAVRLKNRLKQMGAGFYSEKRAVADAFIDSNKNKPQYIKDDYSNDLLV